MSAGQIAFAHFLDKQSYFAWIFLFAILFWFLAAAGIIRTKRPELAAKHSQAHTLAAVEGLGFFCCIGSVFIGQTFIERAGFAEVRPKLFSTITAVTIDGLPAQDSVRLVAALRGTHHVGAHHSSPSANHRIVMQTAKGRLILDMARDSTNPREFWIFSPTFNENSEIGRTFADNLIDIPTK